MLVSLESQESKESDDFLMGGITVSIYLELQMIPRLRKNNCTATKKMMMINII